MRPITALQAGFEGPIGYDKGTNKDGPERGVCTSGRGLIDAIEERQL